LSARGISLAYGGQTILQNLDLNVAAGEIVALLGPSGVGKSSLLRVLAGLQAPTQGEVSFLGQAVRGVHPALAMAFQEAILLPWLNVQANTGFGLGFARQPCVSAAERRQRVEQALRQVGLYESRHQRPGALSGGMAQRVAIARCLARRPQVLLMDEPFGALDEVTRRQMQELILSIRDQTGCAIVLVTHDIDEALLLADRAPAFRGPSCQFAAGMELPGPSPISSGQLASDHTPGNCGQSGAKPLPGGSRLCFVRCSL
jgi:NitT/TauT family transport system ATP-binding protein